MIIRRSLGTILILTVLVAGTRAQEEAKSPPGVDRLQKAEDEFWKGQNRIEAAFRKGVAEAIEAADKIEIFLLEFDSLKEIEDPFDENVVDDQRFPIRPYKATAKILQRHTLTKAELNELRPALKAVVGVEKETGRAFCHLPVHGLRVFEGDEIIFESSFCYLCQNLYVRYPTGAAWFGMSSKEFEALMKRLMLIPDSELKRFKAYSKEKAKD